MPGFARLDLRYPAPTRVRMRIDASDVSGTDTDGGEFLGSFQAPSNDLLDSVYGLRSVLAGEEASLLHFSDWRLRLWARPRDGGTVELSVEDYENAKVRVPVRTTYLCETFVAAGWAYLRRLREADEDEVCYRTALSVGLEDLEQRTAHYREHGATDEYEPTIDRTRLETYVFECRRNDSLTGFVPETDALDEFVRALPDRDDEYVDDAYRELLQHRDAVCARVLRQLRDHPCPDDRARPYLRNVCWSNDPELRSLALEVLETVDRAAALDAALTLAKDRDPEAVVTAARLFDDVGAASVRDARRATIGGVLGRAADRMDNADAADQVRRIADRFNS